VTGADGTEPAGLARRLSATLYEALVLTALLFGVGFVLLPLVTPGPDWHSGAALARGESLQTHYLMSAAARAWSGVVLFLVCGAYCAGFWSGGRRTLPMKTWRLWLCGSDGRSVAASTAIARYVACWVAPVLALGAHAILYPLGHGRWALGLLAVNYAWALADRDRQFLQDRIAGTRLMVEARRGD
jgi:uncharacterized RDD family membrane protein YckC